MPADPAYAVRKVDAFELLTDDTNGRGRVIVVSLEEDRAWTYCWPVRNRGGSADILGWISDCDIGYVAGKMGASDWFDHRATIGAVVERLEAAGQRDRDLGELEGVRDDGGWQAWLATDGAEIEDAWDCVRHGIDPDFRRAFEAVWPPRGGRFPKPEVTLCP